MGTLYIVVAPAGDPDDITHRALRILRDATIVVSTDDDLARRLLACHDISTPLVAATDADALLDTLATADAALLIPGWLAGPSGPGQRLVRAAIEHGFPLAPVPGPALLVTALVISGLPADSFIYLGEQAAFARQGLLAAIVSEHRTLVLLESPARLPDTLADLHDVLGDRPLVIVTASVQGTKAIWRGTLGTMPEDSLGAIPESWLALVVGGTRAQPIPWDEDRLRDEVRVRLNQSIGTKEISRQLATASGWPRREIYRLVVEIARRDFSSQ